MYWLKYPFLIFGKLVALACIFFGGGILAVVVLPSLALIPGNRRERTLFLVHKSFRVYLTTLQFFGLISLEILDPEQRLRNGGTMVIANHPSLLDVVILMALIPRVQCIIKHELWNHRFLGILMRQAGYVRNDLDPETLVAACRASLDEGRCLIIFPEGTRTPPGTLPHFQRGFANIATLTKAPIQLVFIGCTPPFLFKGEPWWHYPSQKPFFQIVVGECLDAHAYSLYDQRSIAARKLVKSLELYYATQITHGRS
jgi:1-acyl-sn-glycerol-3-phosphate acyltransferase